MVWIVATILIIVFYKYVEKKHKLAVFKAIGVITSIFFIIIGYYYFADYYDDYHKNNSASVSLYINQLSITDEIIKEVANLYPEYSSTEDSKTLLDVIENFNKEKTLGKFDFIPFSVKYYDEEIKFYKYVEEEKEIVFIEESVSTLIKINKNLVPSEFSFKNSISDGKEIKNVYSILTSQKWLDIFNKSLSKQQFHNINRYEKLIKVFNNLYEQIKTPSTKNYSFKICNKYSRNLNKITFRVSGFEEGRSTKKSIRTNEPSYNNYTEFDSDIIILPNNCNVISWSGSYKIFDKYKIFEQEPEWQD